jgi:hypothetical protein
MVVASGVLLLGVFGPFKLPLYDPARGRSFGNSPYDAGRTHLVLSLIGAALSVRIFLSGAFDIRDGLCYRRMFKNRRENRVPLVTERRVSLWDRELDGRR